MVWFNNGKCAILGPNYDGTGGGTAVPEGPMDLEADAIGIALMEEGVYTVNIDTHQDFADIAADEITATGYVARGDGVFLGSKTITLDNANDRGEFDAADHVYTSIGNGLNDTFDQIVVFRERATGPADADTLLLAHATVSATTTNGGNITLVFNVEGLLQLTA